MDVWAGNERRLEVAVVEWPGTMRYGVEMYGSQ
jgi:hypothetical protein